MPRALVLLIAVICPVGLQAEDKEKPKGIEGSWKVESIEFNGEKLEDLGGKLTFVFDAKTFKVKGDDGIEKDYAELTYKLDASVNPHLLDLSVSQGDQKDAKFEGIVEVKDDTLRLCVKVIGNERPLKFESPENAQIALIVAHREK